MLLTTLLEITAGQGLAAIGSGLAAAGAGIGIGFDTVFRSQPFDFSTH